MLTIITGDDIPMKEGFLFYKRNGIELFALPFRIILQEEFGGNWDKFQEKPFPCCSVDTLQGHIQKRG